MHMSIGKRAKILLAGLGFLAIFYICVRAFEALGFHRDDNIFALWSIMTVIMLVIMGQWLVLLYRPVKNLMLFDYPYYIIAGVGISLGMFSFQNNIWFSHAMEREKVLNIAVGRLDLECLREFGHWFLSPQEDPDFHEKVCEAVARTAVWLKVDGEFLDQSDLWLENGQTTTDRKLVSHTAQTLIKRLENSSNITVFRKGYGVERDNPLMPGFLNEDPENKLTELLFFTESGTLDIQFPKGNFIGPPPEIPDGRPKLTKSIFAARDALGAYEYDVRKMRSRVSYPGRMVELFIYWPFVLGVALSIKLAKTTADFMKDRWRRDSSPIEK